LSDVTLADAIAEMNRYSREAVVAQVSEARPIRVTGLFRAGDSMSFARAVAEAYQLKVVKQDGEIHLVSAGDVPTN
jgi:transmembrane sensor